MKTYVLLVGAKRNVGDHLIVDRATRLLGAVRPDRELVPLPRWEGLDVHLDVVNRAEALILCGGPALQRHLYPGIYPLVEDLERIRAPVVALGLGWKAIPGDERDLRRFAFDGPSARLLDRLAGDGHVSVRDRLAVRVLEAAGVPGAAMTGDPAWYDLDHLGRPLQPLAEPERVVISVPAAPMHHPAVEPLARALAERYPDAEVLAAFHHGWTAGPHVPERSARAYADLRRRLERVGVEGVDLAANLAAMESTYGPGTLHVGWRLHAHLLCLSRRQPSFLLEEDCRGRGASEALGLPGVRSWSAPLRLGRYSKLTHRSAAVAEVLAMIDEESAAGWPSARAVPDLIDETFELAMRPFLERLP